VPRAPFLEKNAGESPRLLKSEYTSQTFRPRWERRLSPAFFSRMPAPFFTPVVITLELVMNEADNQESGHI
jgi:hypothetical protein